jgi:probable phosphoglycerate mutase
MTKIILIRHATTDSVGKRLSGRMTGVHLNEEGRQQANSLAERLAGLQINEIHSSPLERATQTAEPLAKSLQLTTIINEDFLEMNFGEWTNKSFEELKNDNQFQLFNTFRSSTRIPGGESMMEAQTRIVTGIHKLVSKHPNQNIAVFSHSDMIKSAIAHFAGIHLDMFQRIEISPASVSIIEFYDEAIRIIVVNHTGNIKF